MAARVLVVDDDPSILLFVREALDFEGFQVQVAADGLQALEVLEADPHPCLLLLDMRMPRASGWDVARAMRERRQVATCVITAAQDARAWAREIGAAAVLPKPFDLDDLYAVVERHCDGGARGVQRVA